MLLSPALAASVAALAIAGCGSSSSASSSSPYSASSKPSTSSGRAMVQVRSTKLGRILLFVANAAACVVAIAGLAYDRTRAPAAFAGIAISALALSGLVLSYAVGLFGWMEAGMRAPIAFAIGSEAGAVIVLAAGLAGTVVRSDREA
jgi:hypothetical protein